MISLSMFFIKASVKADMNIPSLSFFLGTIAVMPAISTPQPRAQELSAEMRQYHSILKSIFPNSKNSPADFVLMGSLGMAPKPSIPQTNDRQQDCNQENPEGKSYKIIDGREVKSSSKYPWMAKIDTSLALCSGSIISFNKILTALHCVRESEESESTLPVSDLTVAVGSVDLVGDSNSVYGVQSVIIPPKQPGWGPDFAILVLNTTLPKCNPNIKPICLCDTPTQVLEPGTILTALGWGLTSANGTGPASSTLKEAKVTVISNDECFEESPDHFCAKYVDGATCSGDSGGPIVTLKHGKYVQFGVNSYIKNSEHGAAYCETSNHMGFALTTTSTFINTAKPFHTC